MSPEIIKFEPKKDSKIFKHVLKVLKILFKVIYFPIDKILFWFSWKLIKLIFILFLILLPIAYIYFTRTSYIEEQVMKAVKENTNGTIELDVEKFSLFYGITINDIVIKSGQDFNYNPLIKLKQFKFDFNLPAHFVGDVGVKEMSLTRPEIFMEFKDGKSNLDAFQKEPFSIAKAAKKNKDIFKFPFYTKIFIAQKISLKSENIEKAGKTKLIQVFYLLRQSIQYLEFKKQQGLKQYEQQILNGIKGDMSRVKSALKPKGKVLPFPVFDLNLTQPLELSTVQHKKKAKLNHVLRLLETEYKNRDENDLSTLLNIVSTYSVLLDKASNNWQKNGYAVNFNYYPSNLSNDYDKESAIKINEDFEALKKRLREHIEDLKKEQEDLEDEPEELERNKERIAASIEKIEIIENTAPYKEADETRAWIRLRIADKVATKSDKFSLLADPEKINKNARFVLGQAEKLIFSKIPAPPVWEQLLLGFKVLFQFKLNDFVFHFVDPDKNGGMKAVVENFSLRTILLTKKISKVPLPKDEFHSIDFNSSLGDLMDMIDTFLFELNPKEDFRFYIDTKDKEIITKQKKFNFYMRTYLDGATEGSAGKHIQLKANIGSKVLPVVFKKKKLGNMGFSIKYNIQYDPSKDQLDIFQLQTDVLGKTWFRMKGNIKNVQKLNKPEKGKMTTFNFLLDKSDIDLGALRKKMIKMPKLGNLPPFKGNISLAPLSIKGDMKNLEIKGKFTIKNFYAKKGAMYITLPKFVLPYHTMLHPQKFIKTKKFVLSPQELIRRHKNKKRQGKFQLAALFAGAKEAGDQNANITVDKSTAKKQVKYATGLARQLLGLKNFKVGPMTTYINGAPLKLHIHINDAKNFLFNFSLKNFEIAPFANFGKTKAKGRFDITLSMKGKSVFKQKIKLKMKSKKFRYVLNYSPSGINKIDISSDIDVVLDPSSGNPEQININKFNIFHKGEYSDKPGLALRLTGKTNLTEGIRSTIKLKQLKINLGRLLSSLDAASQEGLVKLAQDIKKNIKISGETKLRIDENNDLSVKHNTYIDMQYKNFNMSDLHLEADVARRGRSWLLKKIKFTGLKDSLGLFVKGRVDQKRILDDGHYIYKPFAKVKVDFKFGSDENRKFDEGKFLNGWVKLNANYDHPVLKGNFVIEKFNLNLDNKTKVNNVNLDFPIDFNVEYHKVLNLTSGNKESHLVHGAFIKKPNFTIDSIKTEFELGRTIKWKVFEKKEGRPGFQMRLDLKNNVFEISQMRMDILNGTITANEILFNLGRLKTNEMEYKARLQIKDLDLKKFIMKESRDEITDGAIRMDIFVIGKRIAPAPIENMKAFVSIYKVGKEFGLMGLRVVKPKQSGMSSWVIDKIVNNTMTINAFDLKLVNGLVYSTIRYSTGIIADVTVSPEGEKIEQTRIALSDFINKFQTEAKKRYGKKKKKKKKKQNL